MTTYSLVEGAWKGPDAITGLTMNELVSRDERADARSGAKDAAISICRSYNIRGLCDPAYIANVIEGALERHHEKMAESYKDSVTNFLGAVQAFDDEMGRP